MQATRLFELGILKAAHFDLVKMPETDTKTNRLDVKYAITPLGQAVATLLAQRFTKHTALS